MTASCTNVVFLMNRREAHPYSKWAVVPIAVAGLLSASLELPVEIRRYIPLAIGGGWLSVQGGWTLIRYLHAHPGLHVVEPGRL